MSVITMSAAPNFAPFIIPLNLDEAGAVQRTCAQLQALPAEPRTLRVDCQQLACQRTLGVSHVVSQLLRLRQAGAILYLRRVNPALRRCLTLLRLEPLFVMETAE